MWVIYTVIGFFLLALLVPVAWSLTRVWRHANGTHAVTCPGIGEPALLCLDQWYAVRMHARGDAEGRGSSALNGPTTPTAPASAWRRSPSSTELLVIEGSPSPGRLLLHSSHPPTGRPASGWSALRPQERRWLR